jgi:hypothetical protein
MSSTKSPPASKPPTTRVCPSCAAKNSADAERCWLCHEHLSAGTPAIEWLPTQYERHATFQFSFASLLLTIAVLAVLLGVFRLSPGLGVLAAVIIAPAWIRTCLTVMRRQSSQPQPLALGEKTAIFAVSVAIMVGIGVTIVAAIVGAFASFCGVIAIGSGSHDAAGFGVAALIVAAVAFAVIVVMVAIFRYAWKASRARRS